MGQRLCDYVPAGGKDAENKSIRVMEESAALAQQVADNHEYKDVLLRAFNTARHNIFLYWRLHGTLQSERCSYPKNFQRDIHV